MGDSDSHLKNNLTELTKEDLIDRLMVAEKVMKGLFEVNKKLEDGKAKTQKGPSEADLQT